MISFKHFFIESDNISIQRIPNSDDYFDDEDSDIDVENMSSYSYDLAKRTDLGITRDRELIAIALHNDDPVGAIWSSFENDTYAFDVAVEPKFQGTGIGSKLIDYGIDEFDNYSDIPDSVMEIDVTSSLTKNALERRGFHIIDNMGNNRWLMKK